MPCRICQRQLKACAVSTPVPWVGSTFPYHLQALPRSGSCNSAWQPTFMRCYRDGSRPNAASGLQPARQPRRLSQPQHSAEVCDHVSKLCWRWHCASARRTSLPSQKASSGLCYSQSLHCVKPCRTCNASHLYSFCAGGIRGKWGLVEYTNVLPCVTYGMQTSLWESVQGP